jgi:hypothetical protein
VIVSAWMISMYGIRSPLTVSSSVSATYVPVTRSQQSVGRLGPPRLQPSFAAVRVVSATDRRTRSTPVAKVIPLHPRIKRTGRGSLAGKLVTADDWDSAAVNNSIARDFGPEPPPPDRILSLRTAHAQKRRLASHGET